MTTPLFLHRDHHEPELLAVIKSARREVVVVKAAGALSQILAANGVSDTTTDSCDALNHRPVLEPEEVRACSAYSEGQPSPRTDNE